MQRRTISTVLGFYLVMVAVVTVGKPFFVLGPLWRPEKQRVRRLELIPFGDFFSTTPWWGPLLNLVANIGLFFPFGMLMAMLLAYRPFPGRKAVLLAACVSIGIEISQYIFRAGYTDVDDVILNTFGAWLGVKALETRRISARAALWITGLTSIAVLLMIKVY